MNPRINKQNSNIHNANANKHIEMLEFTKIIHQLKTLAMTAGAREKFDALTPMLSEAELLVKQKETTEARLLMDTKGSIPLGEVDFISDITAAAARGELLGIPQLLQAEQFAVLTSRIKKYLQQGQETNPTVTIALASYGAGMEDLEPLREEIARCIRNGRIDDHASGRLRDIRRKIEQSETHIRQKMESMLKGKKEYFSEQFVTMRNGRYALPVKKEYKFQVSGSVIDMSATKSTCFIEPTAIARLREELELLRIEENNEERKILYELTVVVDGFGKEMLLNAEYMEALDYAFAKAKLSLEMQGVEPVIRTDGKIVIVNGRHPFLNRETCIPLNITLGGKTKGIVVTGPNTGGKTVTLKTVGLCSLMAQSGLHVPCQAAEFTMQTGVLCDVGDGQSISENLSTFSAHITNIIAILNRTDENSLVLLDELGSGTDPAEGMGIAVAVLEALKEKNCLFIATTHYPELKEYAAQTEGITNARMTFDKETLKPLYTLEVGEAGESCAFYIARRMGMSDHMLRRAWEAAYGSKSAPEAGLFAEMQPDEGDGKAERDKKDVRPKMTGASESLEIIRHQEKDIQNQRAKRFSLGDSVVVYPQNKIGIVFETANAKGEVGVQIQKKKEYYNHKRLQLKASAKDMYPEDYDFSVIFESVETRKARKNMEKGRIAAYESKVEWIDRK